VGLRRIYAGLMRVGMGTAGGTTERAKMKNVMHQMTMDIRGDKERMMKGGKRCARRKGVTHQMNTKFKIRGSVCQRQIRMEKLDSPPFHDSSIRTSAVEARVGLVPRSRATASPPSAFARVYKASRASSSAVRFARESRASASYDKI